MRSKWQKRADKQDAEIRAKYGDETADLLNDVTKMAHVPAHEALGWVRKNIDSIRDSFDNPETADVDVILGKIRQRNMHYAIALASSMQAARALRLDEDLIRNIMVGTAGILLDRFAEELNKENQ